MSKHRLEPPPRVRPRLGRMAAAGLSLIVTGVALLGGIGVIPLGGAGTAAGNGDATNVSDSVAGVGSPLGATSSSTPQVKATPESTPSASSGTSTTKPGTSARTAGTALPDASGTGRRVVFSMSRQRVWLVDPKGDPLSTYLVSGSVTDNLHPGSYSVYSRSRWAVGIEDSGVMQYFVRFTRGNNAAIGFHSIPTKNGTALQTESQLGTPQSHGCIRQKLSDAERMWNFADDGTPVVVIA